MIPSYRRFNFYSLEGLSMLIKALGLINHSISYRTMYSVLTSIIHVILEMFPLTGNVGPLNPTQRVVGIFVPSTSDLSDVYLTLWAYCTDSTGRWKRKPVSVLEMETRFRFGNRNPFPFPTLETKWIRVSVQIQTIAPCYGARRWSRKLMPFAYGKTRRPRSCHTKVRT
jgi:hypothetical protein